MNEYLQLAKPRIGFMIALTAIMGYLATVEPGKINFSHLGILTLVMLLGSASSAIFNHFYDRDIDRLMPRTSQRPFAKRTIKNPLVTLWVAGICLIGGCSLAIYFFNPAVAAHLFLGAFIYGVVYTIWLKRRNWMNIVIGGLAGSFAVMAGAAAVDPDKWFLPTLLAIVLFFWTPTHFWALAIHLKDQYAKAAVPMLPVVKGCKTTSRWIFVNSLLLVGSSLLPYAFGELGHVYGIGALAVGLYLLRLNWTLMQDRSSPVAMKNFFASMKYLAALFVLVILDVHLPF